jgi:hypothetical protein
MKSVRRVQEGRGDAFFCQLPLKCRDIFARSRSNACTRRVDCSKRNRFRKQRLSLLGRTHDREHRAGGHALDQPTTFRDGAQRVFKRKDLGEAGGDEFADAVTERHSRAYAKAHPQLRQGVRHREDRRLRILGIAQQLLSFVDLVALRMQQRPQIQTDMFAQNFGTLVELAAEDRLFLVKLPTHVDVLGPLTGKHKRYWLLQSAAQSTD